MLQVTEAAYDRMFRVNAKGRFFTVQKAVRAVRPGGAVIVIGSDATLQPVPGFGLYATSKLPPGYLVGVIAQEVAGLDVTVNVVLATATDGAGHFAAAPAKTRCDSLRSEPGPRERAYEPSATSPTPSSTSSVRWRGG